MAFVLGFITPFIIAIFFLAAIAPWMQGGDEMSRLDDAISDVAYILDTLIAYRHIIESGDCNNCGERKGCQYVPKLGEQVRYNCPFYKTNEVTE